MAKDLGPDKVQKIYPDAEGGSQVYMGNSSDFDEQIFNVSFGKNSHLDHDQKKQGSLHFWNTEGSPINYNSGAKSGRSTRIDVYPGGGMWKNKTEYSWKENDGFLYNERGIKNGEFTTYIRVHKALGTHQAYAHKVGGRDEDAIRSLAEMVYPTDGKNTVAFNYNYAHFPYVHAKAKTLKELEEFGEDFGWLALKTIHIVKDDHTDWEMWADFDPIADDGTIKNNWEKIAEFRDEGCDDYDNVPVSWKCHKDVCRVDGFGSVDFALFSDREIDPNREDDAPDNEEKIDPAKPVDTQSRPEVDPNIDDNSVEDVLNAQAFLKTHPDIAKKLKESHNKKK
jgi:hypothetical protein